ncbi:MAG: flagellar biosynthetic protein FliO [Candidatus Eremiobacteraeota bacterium]|nr:flagellar biosynthetic protein FliO [Candidatus Eremiobacteraeota bacterium]
MPIGFVEQYIVALLIIGLLLFGLYSVVRALGRGRLFVGADKRLVNIIESTFLSQNTTIHIVKIAERYYIVGGGGGNLAMLGQIEPEQIDPWLENQRKLFNEQTQSVTGFMKYLRKPPQ